MLPRLKSGTCNVLCHREKNVIWSDSKSGKYYMQCKRKMPRSFMPTACVRFSVNILLTYLFIYFKATTITYNAVHSKLMVKD